LTWLKQFVNEEVRRFYLSKDTFDAIPISVEFVPEIEAVPLEGRFEPVSIIDEKRDVADTEFLVDAGGYLTALHPYSVKTQNRVTALCW
jgi:hypothetical protein